MKSTISALCLLMAASCIQAQVVYTESGSAILGLRSFWQGFNRGYYKRSGKSAMNENCIGESTM